MIVPSNIQPIQVNVVGDGDLGNLSRVEIQARSGKTLVVELPVPDDMKH